MAHIERRHGLGRMDVQAVTGPRMHCRYEAHIPYDVCMLARLPWRPRPALICLACHPL